MKSAAGSGAPRATSSFETMSVSELAMQQAASAAEQATAPSKRPPDKGRSMSIAPRKLSAANVAMVTAAWGAVSSDATPRTSLKFDSQSSSASMGSSLVVNQRAMRDVQHVAQGAPGADYELLEVIGKGGMGVVYSARQASVDRIVAVKMIRPKAAADQQRREKFLSEAVVTGDLDHPNIVPIYELGSNEENALFYSMKRVQGTPWGDCIAEKSLAENLEILMKVSDAVAFAHSNGVIHRDLKPENIMLGDFGEVLVMDWGLALATSAFRHADFVSTTENMGGTPAYMAPEMVTGPFESIGPASDIYLLGALLYEVVSGLRPHHGETAQACLMAAARNEIQLCEQTGELIDIAYRALSTEPADRHASVQEFQTAIREYHSHTESAALSTRADQELAQAKKTGDYQSFAHAVFGFEEAHALWTGNTRARAGISEARLAYASCAEQKGDFELGVSLLEADDPTHAPLRAALLAAQREREARQKWLTRFKRIAAAMVMIVFGVITASLVVVSRAKNQEAAAKEQ
ncbi:MAG TPA: serine/threonine-protein kinase, partial [Pirellulales bacterium]|nr:serine/threonine-protein kinase [Pirellulales bacterium]